MAALNAYTLTQARSMLALCKEALEALLTGQAKHYKIGSREYTALDIDDLLKQIVYFSNIVEAQEGSVRTNRVARVVPRDL